MKTPYFDKYIPIISNGLIVGYVWEVKEEE